MVSSRHNLPIKLEFRRRANKSLRKKQPKELEKLKKLKTLTIWKGTITFLSLLDPMEAQMILIKIRTKSLRSVIMSMTLKSSRETSEHHSVELHFLAVF